MAAGPFIFPNKAKLNFFNAAGLLGANTANFRLALFTSALTPNDGDAGHEVLADISANEIAAGNGYNAGGGVMTGVALSQTGGSVKFTANPFTWTASGGSIPAWRYGYVYYLGTLNGKVNPLVGHFVGDSTPADIPATGTGGSLTVTPNASGILTAN